MLNRPDYKKLIKLLKLHIEDQKPSGLIAITKGLLSFNFHGRDFEQSWPRALKECGLVDDGTGTETFTIPGYGLMDQAKTIPLRVSDIPRIIRGATAMKQSVDQPGEIYDDPDDA